jgi:hypothetical protein
LIRRKTPNPKSQIPNKSQITSSNVPNKLLGEPQRSMGLNFGAWNLFEIWGLGFGVSAGLPAVI